MIDIICKYKLTMCLYILKIYKHMFLFNYLKLNNINFTLYKQ